MDDSLCIPGIHVIGGKVYVAGIFDGKSRTTGDRRTSSGYFELDALYRSDSIIEVDDRVLFLLPPINESVTTPIKTLRLARAYSKYAKVLEGDIYIISRIALSTFININCWFSYRISIVTYASICSTNSVHLIVRR